MGWISWGRVYQCLLTSKCRKNCPIFTMKMVIKVDLQNNYSNSKGSEANTFFYGQRNISNFSNPTFSNFSKPTFLAVWAHQHNPYTPGSNESKPKNINKLNKSETLRLVKSEDVSEGRIFDHERQLLSSRRQYSKNCCSF